MGGVGAGGEPREARHAGDAGEAGQRRQGRERPASRRRLRWRRGRGVLLVVGGRRLQGGAGEEGEGEEEGERGHASHGIGLAGCRPARIGRGLLLYEAAKEGSVYIGRSALWR